MHHVKNAEWQPLILALAGTLLVLALALSSQAQADVRTFQTVPSPTPPEVPTPSPGLTPGQVQEATPPGNPLAVQHRVLPQDVLPGEELEFRLWLTNTSSSPVTGIVLADPLDPALDLQQVNATQGAVEVRNQYLLLHLGTLEPRQSALATIRARVAEETQAGRIILNQVTVYFDGGQMTTDVVAAGLPPNALPATGHNRREP